MHKNKTRHKRLHLGEGNCSIAIIKNRIVDIILVFLQMVLSATACHPAGASTLSVGVLRYDAFQFVMLERYLHLNLSNSLIVHLKIRMWHDRP